MNVPDRQLIAEAIAINHADAGKKTLAKYAKHLDHWAGYMESHGLTFVTLQRRHVRLFMAHLGSGSFKLTHYHPPRERKLLRGQAGDDDRVA